MRARLRLPKNFTTMKKSILALAAFAIFALTACDRDPRPLSLDTFDVRWYDDDADGTQTADDALTFAVSMSTTDPDPDDQFITEWEFAYFINDDFGGVLLGDENIQSNTVTFDADVTIGNLAFPGPGSLQKGDVVEFRVWARDNFGTELERTHRFVLEN
jgi:hypothetical protein